MKKILIHSLLLFILPVPGFSQFTHLGPEAVLSSQVKEPGIGIQVIFRVNDEIKLTPGALYCLPHKITTPLGTHQFDWWMINLDGNYVIVDQGMFEGYGIMGLNFANITGEVDEEIAAGTFYRDRRTITKLGLNIGAGLRLNLGDRIVPFGELKYTLGSKADFTFSEISTSQFGIGAGVLVRIAGDKDRTVDEDF